MSDENQYPVDEFDAALTKKVDAPKEVVVKDDAPKTREGMLVPDPPSPEYLAKARARMMADNNAWSNVIDDGDYRIRRESAARKHTLKRSRFRGINDGTEIKGS